jgi:adenine-specific DNA-methyltransferase
LAAIDDLIAQVDDAPLRSRLKEEADRLRRDKKFGLVFEEHLPELTPIYGAALRPGCLAAPRGAPLTDVWRVLQVEAGRAHCLQRASGEHAFFDAAELVVVLEFGDAIFPALTPLERVQNGPAGAPWHTLIEADNYHALQLLEYLYAGQVDCIYIDPPYNTGARDWKYNNDYVDANDRWRHSKWLAMMRRRLALARRLLNPKTGVLMVTIDEHEVHHLGMLLEHVFPECARQMVTIVINQKGVSQGRLARVEEYAIFVFMADAYLDTHHDDLLSPDRSNIRRFTTPRWEWLLRGGNNSRREDRPGLFYPIFIDPERQVITGIGEVLPLEQLPDLEEAAKGTVAWPIRTDGSFGNWQLQPSTLREVLKLGYVRLGGFHKNRVTWTVQYLNKGTRARIDKGEILVVGRNPVAGEVIVEYANSEARRRNVKTVWYRGIHDSGIYGSSMLRYAVGNEVKFAFPKSVYAVRDAVGAVVRNNPNALIVDFFAGSGTTLNAVELLNEHDDGRRRCILVTNNEVSEDEARSLAAQGHHPGDEAWEQHGVCRSVTWPRSKFTILGRRDDGTRLEGDYLTGRTVTKTKARTFRQLSFVDPATLTTAARKREVAALIDAIPGSQIKAGDPFFVSAEPRHTAALLFDDAHEAAFLDALEGMEHITHFYIVTPDGRRFRALQAEIEALLGPIEVQEEERRPMAAGFPANLEYFRLDFLDKDQVALGQQFRAILPLLWLRAGAAGPRPDLPADAPLPEMLIPPANPFAVLVDERRFAAFLEALAARPDLTHVFLVTDSEDAFQEMAARVQAPHVIQLYRDYLENFMINRGTTP